MLLPACQTEEDKTEQTQSSAQNTGQTNAASAGETAQASGPDEQAPEDPKTPQILVGAQSLSTPAPAGFTRIEQTNALFGKVAVQPGETLLALFARPVPGDAAQDAPEAAPDNFDLLNITSLEKWLFSQFSLEDFANIITPWKEASVVCNQETLDYFVKAANSRLAAAPEYTYKLGLIGFDRQQISFASIIKKAGADGKEKYICALDSLLYRNGKILGLSCRVRIGNLAEIGPAIDNYLKYLHSLQALDNKV